MAYSKKRSLQALAAFLPVFLWNISGTPVLAQDFNDMRHYIEVRDAAAAVKLELERAASGASGSVLLANPKAEQEIMDMLNWLDERAKEFEGQASPLSVYYNDRLSRILTDCHRLYPHFIKRRALGARIGVMTLPLEQPKDGLVVMQTPAPAPNPASAIAPALHAPAAPLVRPKTAVLDSPGSAETASDADPATMLTQRRAFFHPIGVRILLPQAGTPVVATFPGAAQPAVAMIPGTAASGAVAVTPPPASFPELPSPVAQAPAAFTPLEPWTGGPDPQVRQTPGMRPLAIMIENHNQARPQTAMHEAEVVYEIPVEGGITRFMALFYHVPAIVGPVRSCREYFVDRALEVNALYVHCGGSPNGYKYIGDQKVFSIDEISNGTPFIRDNSRKAPHNLYTKPQKLIEVMNQKYPMQLPYQKLPLPYGENPTAGNLACNGVSIRYHGNYTASYKLNARTGRYDRYMNGAQQLDRVTLKPVSPGTVVIQMANMRVIDDKGRQEISFIGEGRGLVLYGGTARQIIWKKTAPREFTRYFDEAGKPFFFSNKSPVWIQVVAPINRLAFDPPVPKKVMAFLGAQEPPAKAATAAAVAKTTAAQASAKAPEKTSSTPKPAPASASAQLPVAAASQSGTL